MSNKLNTITVFKDDQIIDPFLYNRILVSKNVATLNLSINSSFQNVSFECIIDGSLLDTKSGCLITSWAESGPIELGYGRLTNGSNLVFSLINGIATLERQTSSSSKDRGLVTLGHHSGPWTDYTGATALKTGVFIGNNTGASLINGNDLVIIGTSSGDGSFEDHSILIGYNAGFGTVNKRCIILNASPAGFGANNDGFFVKPVSATSGSGGIVMYYNPTTFEISYGAPPPPLNSLLASTSDKIMELPEYLNEDVILALVEGDLKSQSRIEELEKQINELKLYIENYDKRLELQTLEIERLKSKNPKIPFS
jgi:hypothetical protein